MTEHRVIWVNPARPSSLFAGSLRVSADGIRLDGAGPGGLWTADLPWVEIVGVARSRAGSALGRRPWIRLELGGGGALLVGTVLGARALADLHEAIARRHETEPPETARLRARCAALVRPLRRTPASLRRACRRTASARRSADSFSDRSPV